MKYTYDDFGRIVNEESIYEYYYNKTSDFDRNESFVYRTYGDGNTDLLVSEFTSTVNGTSTVYNYTYDGRGYILTERKGGTTYTYTYDDLGQLTSVNDGTSTLSYYYDNAGNLTGVTRTVNGVTSTSKTLSYSDSEWGDLLISYNGIAITYDRVGNPLSYYNGSSYSFAWEGRRLVAAVRGSTTMSFTYNDEGLRTSKTVNGVTTNYYYDSGMLVAEETAGSITMYMYDAYGSPIGFTYHDSAYASGVVDTYWYDRNLQGDIVAVYDASGVKLISYKYDAWGSIATSYYNSGASTNAIKNNLKYRSYYYDAETQLYWVSSRYYSPELCRWISSDSIEYLDPSSINGLNLYCYCANDPVNKYDPTGHFAISVGFLIGSILIGAAFGAGISGAVAYAEGERGWDLAWDIVGGGIFGAAIGATAALGGAAGLAATGAKIAVGASTTVLNVSMGTALGIAIGGTVFASATKYSLDCAASDRQWNLGGYLVEAGQGAIQGAATFGLAYLGGKAGLFNKIGDFKGWYDFYLGYGGMNNLKMISYISNLIIGPTLSKMLFVSGLGAGIRWIIDKLIPEL